VLGNDSILDAEEVQRREVGRPAGLGDGAVESARRCADENDWLRSPNETNTAEIAAPSPAPL
jgi:hypothetical protein